MKGNKITMGETTHKMLKTNLGTLSNGGDNYACSKCGIKAHRPAFQDCLIFDGRLKRERLIHCPQADKDEYIGRKVRISLESVQYVNDQYKNLLVGTEWPIVSPPEEYPNLPNTDRSIWLDGISEKVRLLGGEFEFLPAVSHE